MTKMTPAQVYDAAMQRYRDPELAMRLAARAEGILGRGKAPTDTDARKGASQLSRATVEKREAAILEAIARGLQTVSKMAKATGLNNQVIRDRLSAMQAEGRVRSVGSLSNRVKVWEVVG